MLTSQLVGLAGAVALAVATREPVPAPDRLVWAAVAGMGGAIALAAFYRGLASGRMGVVAPIAGVLAAMVPVVLAGVLEGLPSPPQLAGMGAALAAIVLVSWTSGRDEAGSLSASVGLAIVAGLGFGAFYVLIDQAAATGSSSWPLAASRGASIVLVTALVLASRTPVRGLRRVTPLIVLTGLLDLGGNVFFLVATGAGRLDVASVLSSLYPIVTVALAGLVFKERVGVIHGVGIALAGLAIVLIAAG